MVNNFTDGFLRDLSHVMVSKKVGPEFILINEGEYSNKLYFINKGIA